MVVCGEGWVISVTNQYVISSKRTEFVPVCPHSLLISLLEESLTHGKSSIDTR